jgi:peptidoglycan-associated lipoprotein
MSKLFAFLMTIAAVSVAADAQTTAAHPASTVTELAVGYSFLHANAPPDRCGCFSLNGGSVSLALPATIPGPAGRFALAVDATVAHGSGISNRSYDLTLGAFTAGLRYRPNGALGPFKPFFQVLAGGAHAGGSLGSGNTPMASESALVFASNIGGGLDLNSHPGGHVTWRLVEADYLVTLFNNGSNDHQNILRLGAGIVFRFGRH